MLSKIAEFRIGKGVTQRIPGSETEHTRKYLELLVRLPEQMTEEGFQEALLKAESLLDSWLEQQEPPQIPQLDIAEVQSLPWVSYQTKQPCQKPDEAGWVFADPSRHEGEKQKIVNELATAIEKAPKNKLQLGDMLYTFSGPKEDKKLFISRRPSREKE
jgi:hypothetical protein